MKVQFDLKQIVYVTKWSLKTDSRYVTNPSLPERIYNPIMAMGFSAMFTFQLDNTKR